MKYDIGGPDLIVKLLSRETNLDGDVMAVSIARWQKAAIAAANAGRKVPIEDDLAGAGVALLVIDMQRAFLDPGAAVEVPAGRDIISNINAIAKAVRSAGGRVLFFRYSVQDNPGLLPRFEGKSYIGSGRESPMRALMPGHAQFELHPALEVQPQDEIWNKNRYSAVLGSPIVPWLRDHKIANVIVTGVATDVCAGNTAESLMQVDFHVVMAWDGTAALGRLDHELWLVRFFGLYGDVMPTREILDRLRGTALFNP